MVKTPSRRTYFRNSSPQPATGLTATANLHVLQSPMGAPITLARSGAKKTGRRSVVRTSALALAASNSLFVPLVGMDCHVELKSHARLKHTSRGSLRDSLLTALGQPSPCLDA